MAWPWQRIVTIDNAINWWTLNDARATIESLRAFVGGEQPDELWLPDVPNAPMKIAAEAYPKARLVLYEDGLHTYLPGEDHHFGLVRCLR